MGQDIQQQDGSKDRVVEDQPNNNSVYQIVDQSSVGEDHHRKDQLLLCRTILRELPPEITNTLRQVVVVDLQNQRYILDDINQKDQERVQEVDNGEHHKRLSQL